MKFATLAPVLAAAGWAAACAWSEPAPSIDTGGVMTLAAAGASNPTVALAPAGGAAYVAWVGTNGSVSDVYLARSAADSGFAPAVRVNHIRGDAAPHPQAPAQVATGAAGEVYVAWQNNTRIPGRRFPASDLRFARSADGGRTFEPAIYVNDDAGGPPASHTFHDLAVAPDGTIYVSWIDGRASMEDSGGSARRFPTRVRAVMDGGAMAAEHAGHAHGGPGPEIRIARSTDGGRSFEPSRVVDNDACPCCRTSLALGPGGEVYVAWRKVFAGGVRDVVVARSTDGGRTFAAPVRVHRDGWAIDACPHAGPAVAADVAGRVHVAWFTGVDGRAGAWYAVSADRGRHFTRPVRLTPDGPTPTTQVKLAADREGAVWVAWEDPAGPAPAVRLARADGDGRVRGIDAGSLPGTLPSLSVRRGAVAVAWLDGEAVRALRGTDAAH